MGLIYLAMKILWALVGAFGLGAVLIWWRMRRFQTDMERRMTTLQQSMGERIQLAVRVDEQAALIAILQEKVASLDSSHGASLQFLSTEAASLDKRVDGLRPLIGELSNRHESHVAAVGEKLAELVGVRALLRELSARIEGVAASDVLTTKLSEVENRLDVSVQDVAERLSQVMEAQQVLKGELALQSDRLLQRGEEVTALQERTTETGSVVEELIEQQRVVAAQFETKLQGHEAKLQGHEAKLQGHEATQREQDSRLEQGRQATISLHDQQSDAEAHLTQLRLEVSRLADAQTLGAERNDHGQAQLAVRCDELDASLRSRDDVLHATLAVHGQTIDKTAKELLDANERLLSMEDSVAKLPQDWQVRLDAATSRLTQLHEELSHSIERTKSLTDARQSDIEAAAQLQQSWESAHGELKLQLAAAQSENAALISPLLRLPKSFDELLSDTAAHNTAQNSLLTQCAADLTMLSARAAADVAKLNERVHKVEGRLSGADELTPQVDELNQRLDSLGQGVLRDLATLRSEVRRVDPVIAELAAVQDQQMQARNDLAELQVAVASMGEPAEEDPAFSRELLDVIVHRLVTSEQKIESLAGASGAWIDAFEDILREVGKVREDVAARTSEEIVSQLQARLESLESRSAEVPLATTITAAPADERESFAGWRAMVDELLARVAEAERRPERHTTGDVDEVRHLLEEQARQLRGVAADVHRLKDPLEIAQAKLTNLEAQVDTAVRGTAVVLRRADDAFARASEAQHRLDSLQSAERSANLPIAAVGYLTTSHGPVADLSKSEAPSKKRSRTSSEGVDDLKRIRGIGPKLEGLLHGIGIQHFAQLASLSEEELTDLDSKLEAFRGRARRDGWVEQARVLAGSP